MLCITITRQVDEIPSIVDDKVVDSHRLAWNRGSLCQALTLHQQINQRRLAHIRATDEGIFGNIVVRQKLETSVAHQKLGFLDIHGNLFNLNQMRWNIVFIISQVALHLFLKHVADGHQDARLLHFAEARIESSTKRT